MHELKEELGEHKQTTALERILSEFKEMKTQFNALYWVNELNKANNTNNALEL
ncbi:hypothetical protein ZPR_2666 [Zunongwangia profunda SM-A87]|uniref:Uncharacterized protein n=1 Tax=Zunongwangia profunda (strain DSM 18752 / CCTCC AB 206139 / SM-A87) TaxID=655815 RepID=D5BF90_ZUNPS|nr:hypothetical protein ZPR_2666 [Zunongwangia profunda SM-A87]